MSVEIPTWFVKQFDDNIEMLVQQQGSKLRNAVSVENNLNGEKGFYNQLGSTEAQRIKDRHGDTPIMGSPHHRRMITAEGSEWGDLIDQYDQFQMLGDPSSEYAQAGSYALGRDLDLHVLQATNATAYVGKEGTSTKSLPSSQVIPADLDGDGTEENLTLAKLTRAKTLFTNNNVDVTNPMNKLYFVCTGDEIEQLLGIDEVKSSDYNTVKALVAGDVNSYVGFEFITVDPTMLPINSSGIRSCFAWAKSGMKLAIDPDRTTRIAERTDKRFSIQVYLWQRAGATRMQEEKVVEVKVNTTK